MHLVSYGGGCCLLLLFLVASVEPCVRISCATSYTLSFFFLCVYNLSFSLNHLLKLPYPMKHFSYFLFNTFSHFKFWVITFVIICYCIFLICVRNTLILQIFTPMPNSKQENIPTEVKVLNPALNIQDSFIADFSDIRISYNTFIYTHKCEICVFVRSDSQAAIFFELMD